MVEQNSIRQELQKFQEIQSDLETLERYIEEFSAFLPLPVCIVNPLGKITDVNKAFEKLTEYRSIEIVGEPLVKNFLEKEKLEEIFKKVIKDESIRDKELILITKKGKEIPVSISISKRKDKEEDFIGYFVGITNIAEFKELQEKLEEKVKERTKELEESKIALMNTLEDVEGAKKEAEGEKEKTLAVITNLTDGLLVFDKKDNLVLINPQAKVFLGVKKQDIIEKSILELKTIPVFRFLITIFGEEIKKVSRQELSLKSNLILEVSTVPIITGEEEIGTLVILHDVTREKAIEKMKTEFVSLAAHQLRTPLSIIKWSLGMLSAGQFGKITKKQKEFTERAYKNNQRLISIVNNLLDITRIEEGRYISKQTLANIEKIIESIINSSREEIEKKKIKLEFKKSAIEMPKLILDEEKIKIAVQNFLDNAIKYSSIGNKIIISLRVSKKDIEFEIQDSGIGIPQEQKDRVFTKFFRGSNAAAIETTGSGLGLFVAKNIIEAHGGKVWFKSKKNKGSTFYFNLPLKKG